jgi:hypothetical protein
MDELKLESVKHPDFATQASYVDGAISLRIYGSADGSARSPLEALLTGVHAESQRLKAQRVVIDLTALEFMNSSCFKSFVSWIENVQYLDPGAQYRITFLSNPETHWQRRSLKALSCFAADLITVEP